MISQTNSPRAIQPVAASTNNKLPPALVVEKKIPTKNSDQSHQNQNLSSRKRKLESANLNLVYDNPLYKKTEFKDVVYIWVVPPGSFDPERDETPVLNYQGKQFLQNAIAHSRNYNVTVLFFDKNKDPAQRENVDISFQRLGERLKDEGINMQLIDANKLLPDDKIKSEMSSNQCTGVSVDLLKMKVGANLGEIGIKDALIADFDTELPSQLTIDMCDSTVMPMVDKTLEYTVCEFGHIEHFIENGFCFVSGEKNSCYQTMLEKLEDKTDGYGSLSIHDVYCQFARSVLLELTPDDKMDESTDKNDILARYRYFDCMSDRIKKTVNDYKIDFERGDTWQPSTKRKKRIPIPIELKSMSKPIYQREIDDIYYKILLIQMDMERIEELIKHLDKMIEKGFDINSILQKNWVNSLQRKGTAFDHAIDRLKGKDLYDVCEYLLRKGAIIEKDTFDLVVIGKRFRQPYDERIKNLLLGRH